MESNNKRIAKNTFFLYIRMLLNMGIMFYASRVVLNTLGVDDFGIYGVVGGIISMFGFLNSSMAGATSRFMTFELGRQDYDKLKKTFSAALTVHIIIAVIILVLGETLGLWWLENKLVIAPDRMNAARWVFHLSVFASIIGITQAPYNATIIAHERMNVYAYVDILNSLLKLGIVFLLVAGNFDKLILYAVLTLCVTIIITTVYKIYCTRNFEESHYKFHWDKEIIKPMISFSGWNLVGTVSYIAKTQGVNILLNLFFGVVVNATYGIATQVQSAVSNFSNSFLTAVRPQIVKYYAANNIPKMQNLIINASKYSLLLMLLITFPIILESNFVLRIWLKIVPDYAVSFCRLSLIYALISSVYSPIMFAIHATGNVKKLSNISGLLYILVLPIAYTLLKLGFPPIVPFVVNIVLVCIGFLINLHILKELVPQFSVKKFIENVVGKGMLVVILSSIIPLYIFYSLPESFVRFLSVLLFAAVMICITGYFIALDKNMRNNILQSLKEKNKFI